MHDLSLFLSLSLKCLQQPHELCFMECGLSGQRNVCWYRIYGMVKFFRELFVFVDRWRCCFFLCSKYRFVGEMWYSIMSLFSCCKMDNKNCCDSRCIYCTHSHMFVDSSGLRIVGPQVLNFTLYCLI